MGSQIERLSQKANAQDVHKTFIVFGFNPMHIGAIILLVIVSGFVSAVLPLTANMRRNPIRDMRDEG